MLASRDRRCTSCRPAELGGQGTFDFTALTSLGMDAEHAEDGCSSASSSPSRSRRRCGRSTPGCRTPAAEATPGDGGAAGRRARQGRHLRHAALLPAAVPGRRRSASRRWCIALARRSASSTARSLAIGQTDMMRLIAYTSISHFGFIVLGIFALTTPGPVAGRRSTWSTTASRPPRCSWSPASWSAGAASQLIADYGGVAEGRAGAGRASSWSPACRRLALPGLAPFVSEFLVLVGTFTALPGGRR